MDAATTRYLDADALEQRYSRHRNTFARWQKTMGFPMPRYLGNRRFWVVAEIEAWETEWLTKANGLPSNTRNLRPFKPSDSRFQSVP
jgi:predicted DNA-binding transcriptional regulator AlpA